MSTVLKHGSILLVLSLFGSCAPEEPAADAGSVATEEASTANAFERFAGTWSIQAFDEAGDTLPGHILTATSDSTGWFINFVDRPTVPVHVIDVSGDLVVYETARYESVVRPGVQVTVFFVGRSNGDQLNGRFIAHYDVAGSAAILRGMYSGTRQ